MQDLESNLMHAPELDKLLEEFTQMEVKTVSPELLRVLEQISKTGITCYSWPLTKNLLAHCLNQIFAEFRVEDKVFQARCQAFFSALEIFESPPFTIQRLCELVLRPQMYRSPEKYLFAIEKLVAVTSTIPQLSPNEYNAQVKQLFEQKQEAEGKGKEELGVRSQSMDTEDVEKVTPMDVETPGM